MRSIHISDVKIAPNRQRKLFDPAQLQELADSIEKLGLMQPIVLRVEGDDLILVAGERRLRAVTNLAQLDIAIQHDNEQLPLGFIPYSLIGELDEIAREEAELDENFRRANLTWQEHAEALARLEELRKKQSAVDPTVPAPTAATIALETRGTAEGSNQDIVRKELIVARHLSNPEVRAAKTVSEAFKVVKAQEKAEQNRAMAASVGAAYAGTGLPHEIFQQDCLGFLRDYSGPRFDVLLTDPPYGMGADSFGNSGGKLVAIDHTYKDDYDHWKALMAEWVPLVTGVMKEDAHGYIFCDIDRFHELRTLFAAAGWKVFRTPFIVHKIGSGRVPIPDFGPRRSWECLLYVYRGGKRVSYIAPDVIAVQGDDNVGHGAQKPVALFQNLLARSVSPGDRTLDTFGGTGPLLEAADTLKCTAVVVEQDPVWYAECVKRIEKLKSQLNLDL